MEISSESEIELSEDEGAQFFQPDKASDHAKAEDLMGTDVDSVGHDSVENSVGVVEDAMDNYDHSNSSLQGSNVINFEEDNTSHIKDHVKELLDEMLENIPKAREEALKTSLDNSVIIGGRRLGPRNASGSNPAN